MTWLAWLPETALKGAVILATAWLATRLLQRQPAALRHLVWTAALGGLLVLPALAAGMPLRIAVPWRFSPEIVAGSSGAIGGAPRGGEPDGAAPAVLQEPGRDESILPPPAPRAVRIWSRLTPLHWAAMAWLLGSLVLGIRFLAGLRAIHRIRNGSPAPGSMQVALDDAALRVGLGSAPHLVVSDSVTMPCATGFVRPVVLLPVEACKWSADRLDVVLLHELTHIRRGDYLAHVVAEAARIVHWYNPLVWIAARSLRAEAERATDESVVHAGAKASDYAAHLLDIVRGSASARLPAPLMPLAHRSEFEGRLLAILEYAGSPIPRARAAALTFVAVAGLTMLVASVGAATPGTKDQQGAKSTVASEALQPDDPAVSTVVPSDQEQPPVTRSTQDRSTSTIAALTEAINDPVPSVRRAVIEALGKTRDSVAVRALMNVLLEDDNAEVRRVAAWSLGEIDDPLAVPALMEALLRDRDPETRKNAASALGSIGSERSVGSLAQALDSDDDITVRMEAADALGGFEDPAALNALMRSLSRESDPAFKREIIESLDEIDNPRAMQAVIGALRDRDPEVRVAAAQALSSFEDRSAVPSLVTVARDSDTKVRRAVIEALANLPDRRAVDVFATALSDADAEVRASAADGLANIDNLRTAPRELIRAMNDANGEVRHRVAHALGHIQDPAGLDVLIAHIRDQNVEVRRAVVESLTEFGEESASAALRIALRDGDSEVRETAARALGERTRK